MRALRWMVGLLGAVQVCGLGEATADCVDYLEYLHWLGGVPMDWPTGCWVEAVAQAGGYAFVGGAAGDDYGILFAVDVTDPQSPILVTDMLLPRAASDLALAGDCLCVAQGDSGLVTVDVADPRHLTIMGRVDTPGYAASVSVAGKYAYVADWDGLQIVGIQNPSYPVLAGHLALTGITGVAVSGGYAYVAGPESGLIVVAVGNPWYPYVCGSVSTSGYSFTNVATWDHYVVMTTNHHLEVVDVLDPWHPHRVGDLVTSQGYPWFNDLAVLGGRAFVSDMGSMQVVDLSTPSAPRIVGSVPLQGVGSGVVANGSHAFVAVGSGLQIIDTSNPESPPILGGVYTQGYACAMALSEHIGYVANYTGGFAVLDLSDPSAPALVTRMTIPSMTVDVEVSGTHAYAANFGGGLYVIDVSDPADPAIVSNLPLPGITEGVTLAGSYAYLAAREGGLLSVVDITDAHEPLLLGSMTLPGQVMDGSVLGQFLYAACAGSGLQVVDISDPENLEVVGEAGVPGYACEVACWGDYVLVADGVGVRIFDVTDPTHPELAGSFDTFMAADHVAAEGSYAYVGATDPGTVMVFDLRDVASPRLVGDRCMPWGATDPVPGEYLYLLDGQGGVQIMFFQCEMTAAAEPPVPPAQALSLSTFPSPVWDQVDIRLATRESAGIQVNVFDCGGRLVRRVLDGTVDGGARALSWDGRDEEGHRVASGVYLVRVSTHGETRSARIVMVK